MNNDRGPLIFFVLINTPNMLISQGSNGFALLFCLLSALPCTTNAQQPETRVMPATVVTTDGKALTSLQSQNVRIHNRDVRLMSFSLDTSPRRIVLLLDISDSMTISNGNVTLWDAAVHTAGLFLDRVPETDSISVYAFANREKQLVPFTRDHGAIRAAIHGLLKPGSEEAKQEYGTGTRLDEALNSILNLLSESPQFGDTIVIFSDGLLPRSNGDRIMVYYDQPEYLQRVTPRLGMLGVRVFFFSGGPRGGNTTSSRH
ncbi:MAG: vWA domain-containing protein [Candidatus Acidiferrales bacterium]